MRELGVGSGAVRTIAGTMELHEELERRLADFKHVEAVLTFQSGFTANSGVIPTITTEHDLIVSDELNHASIIDGVRLSKASRAVFPHKDVDGLEKVLREARAKGGKNGRVPDDPRHHGRRLLHGRRHRAAAGHLRRGGALRGGGDGRRRPRLGRPGPQRARHRSTTSTSTAASTSRSARSPRPSACWAATSPAASTSGTSSSSAAGRSSSPPRTRPPWPPRASRRSTCWSRSRSASSGCGTTPASSRRASHDLGFDTGISETPITPVIVGDERQGARQMSRAALRAGHLRHVGRLSDRALDKARLRTIVSSEHTRDELQTCLDAFATVGPRTAADLSVSATSPLGLPGRRRDAHRRDARLDDLGRRAGRHAADLHGRDRRRRSRAAATTATLRDRRPSRTGAIAAAEFAAPYGGFQETDLYPDALPAIAALRDEGYRVAIIANQPRERTRRAAGARRRRRRHGHERRAGRPQASARFLRRGTGADGRPAARGRRVRRRPIDNDVRPSAAAGMRAVWLRRGPWGVHRRPTFRPRSTLTVDSLLEVVEPNWPRSGRQLWLS